ncbi:hypothetical protein [Actinoplanes aureus]|uniref:Uncharacterized protein n=1 Tax=Actinoplanes aureus TaxID=2792083 RepID=A0A931CJ09_9ACTN|nr:hypothetical protein [Actinoplanes aureus]MBG0568238.1 hypothetical protein [Actinoplanes aureus]
MMDERWREIDSALLLWMQAATAGLANRNPQAIGGAVMGDNDVLGHARLLERLVQTYPQVHESLLAKVANYEDIVRVAQEVLGEASRR